MWPHRVEKKNILWYVDFTQGNKHALPPKNLLIIYIPANKPLNINLSKYTMNVTEFFSLSFQVSE